MRNSCVSDANHVSEAQSALGGSPAGYPSIATNARTVLNLRAGVDSLDRHWHAMIYGNNVTNTFYWTNLSYTQDDVHRIVGMPVTYGVRVGYDW
jgi:iron complex outermembrane receptor protein